MKDFHQLSKFKLHYEELPFKGKLHKPKLADSILDTLASILSSGVAELGRYIRTHIKKVSVKPPAVRDIIGRLSLPKKLPFRPRWEWLIIAVLLALLLSRHGSIVHADPITHPITYKPLRPLIMPTVASVEPLQPVLPPAPVYVPPPAPAPVAPVYGGSHEDWMAQAGIAPSDYGYVDYIVSHEGGWRVNAYNPSGAYGLCQSLPASKMASAGADYMTNPVTQLIWCNSYAQAKGGWYASYLLWLQQHWW